MDQVRGSVVLFGVEEAENALQQQHAAERQQGAEEDGGETGDGIQQFHLGIVAGRLTVRQIPLGTSTGNAGW